MVSDPSPTHRRTPVGLMAAIAFVTTMLIGVVRVSDQPYWLDEAATHRFVDRPFSALVELVWEQEGGMGPYFLLLWCWQHLFPGDAEMRLLSVIGGAVAAGLLVALAQRWFSSAIAIGAGVLLITNPFFLRYLTELRAYSWLMAAAVAAAWAMIELVADPARRRWWLLTGVAVGAGIALFYLFALWVIAVFLVLVVARRLDRRHVPGIVGAGCGAVVVAAPFLHVITARSGQIDWIPPTSIEVVWRTTRALLGGVFPGVLLAVGIVAALVAFAGTLPRSADTDAAVPVAAGGGAKAAQAVVMAMAAGGPLMLLALSFAKPLIITRYFAASAPFLALAAAWGLVELQRRWSPSLPAVSLPAVWLMGAAAVLSFGGFVVKGPLSDEARPGDARSAVEFVLGEMTPGDLIVTEGPNSAVLHYLGGRPDIDPAWRGKAVDGPYYPRARLAEIAAQLESAPRLFVFLWATEEVSPELGDVLSSRTTTLLDYGATVLIVAER